MRCLELPGNVCKDGGDGLMAINDLLAARVDRQAASRLVSPINSPHQERGERGQRGTGLKIACFLISVLPVLNPQCTVHIGRPLFCMYPPLVLRRQWQLICVQTWPFRYRLLACLHTLGSLWVLQRLTTSLHCARFRAHFWCCSVRDSLPLL